MAITSLEVYDAFSRTSNTSWGTTDSGATWQYLSGSGGVLSVNKGHGQFTIGPNSGTHYVGLTSLSKLTTREILVRFSVTATDAISWGIAFNHNTANGTHYRFHTYGGDVRIMMRDSLQYNTSVNSHTLSSPLIPNEDYWVRMKYEGGQFKVKLWHWGNAEPSSWLVTANPQTAVPVQAGVPALVGFSTSVNYGVNVKAFYTFSGSNLIPSTSYPITDTFSRDNRFTWGLSDTKHLWDGAVLMDPAFNYRSYTGSVDATNYGTYSGQMWADNLHAIGPSVTDSEVKALVMLNGPNAVYRIGLRGAYTKNGEKGLVNSYSGYFAGLARGSNTLYLYYVNNNTYTTIATATLPFTVSDNTLYYVKVQAIKTALRVKVWAHGTAEPSTWLINTTHTALTQGKAINMNALSANEARTYRLYDYRATIVTSIDTLTVGSVTNWELTETSIKYRARYTYDENNNSTISLMYKAEGSETWQTATPSAYFVESGTTKARDFALTGLYPATKYDVTVTYSDVDGVEGGATVQSSFTTLGNSTLIPSNFDVSATTTTEQITVSYAISGDADNDATSTVRVRPVGTTTWGTAVTASKYSRTFTATVGNLLPDTQYEVQITIADADGIRNNGTYGTANFVTTRTYATLGRSVQVVSLTATPTETTALVMLQYAYDLNNDATFTMQYRSSQEKLFTNVNPASITINRSERHAYTTLPNLRPDMSYEVVVYPHDPDGLSPDTPTELRTTFTTNGSVFHLDEKGKHFVYRVYDPEGAYIGTWPDAPDPEFSWSENGGVNDLSVTLPRKFSSLNYERTINFNNRVDVWALDGTSKGMGNNLLEDANGNLGGWTLATSWTAVTDEGADGGPALKFSSTSGTLRRINSEPVYIERVVPITLSAVARATGGKLRMDIAAYDKNDVLIDTVDENAETINAEWQNITVDWLPPSNTRYLRVRIENDGAGTMWVSKVTLLAREMLIYRGEIDEFNVSIGPDGESVTVDILGYPSYLADDYIDFLQFVSIQPQEDINAGRQKLRQDPTDPSNMLKQVIDIAKQQNPRCPLYYTSESIKPTGVTAEYTFRDKLLRDCFDNVVSMCPPRWYYVIDPDGCVWLQSSDEHATLHKLRLNVEISSYKSRRTVRQLKNVIRFKGRQDEDGSEPDGYGTINYVAQDPVSIKRYGRRVLKVTDAQVTSPETAEIIAEGRLEENNMVNESGTIVVPDEKDMKTHEGSLRGYNIQAIKPGDLIQIIDPETGPNRSFWDQFKWDDAEWDAKSHRMLTQPVPVKQVRYEGTTATIELAHLPPTTRGDFARLVGVMRRNMNE